MRVTVMGLGLHGGGLAAARFFVSHGAEVTVTDLRTEEALEASIRGLEGYPVRYVLGRHEEEDFRSCDMVIKNPGVPPDSPFLGMAPRVETDISIFLKLVSVPIIAVTGTKGKSTTVTAVHHVLTGPLPGTRLGGNITVSPLSFADELIPAETAGTEARPEPPSAPGQTGSFVNPPGPAPVVLELSSWQLGDLMGRGLLKPKIAAVTNLLWDHQDRYPLFEDYARDKAVILEEQDPSDYTVLNLDDGWFPWFDRRRRGRLLGFSRSPLPLGTEGAWLDEEGSGWTALDEEREECILEPDAPVPGMHHRTNLLCAGLICRAYGVSAAEVRERLRVFPGVPHRLEPVSNRLNLHIYNDSAATIPDAVLEAVKSFSGSLVLITGGTDKNLDFSPYREAAGYPRAIVLLEGTGTRKIEEVLNDTGKEYFGPYGSLEEAVETAVTNARAGDTVLFSPGCASFGMFLNEFDRGNRFRDLVSAL
jgi:UDP-N-acetylmuramoylalanine--D-glutamate ligase